MVKMSCSKAQHVREQLDRVKKFLEPFSALANMHMTHFITRNLWEKLPEDLRDEALSLSPDDIHRLLWNRNKGVIEHNNPSAVEKFFHNCWLMSLGSKTFVDLMLPTNIQFDSFEGAEKCMSPKKTHEVHSLKEIISNLCESCHLNCVVDLGGGKGYLGASLVLEKNIQVLSIDSKHLNTQGAQHIYEQLEKHLHASKNNPVYKQATALVTPETDLDAIVKENLGSSVEHNICLTGLHVCGDLASTSIQIFCKNQGVLSLCNIGCCYNLLTERFESDKNSKTLPDETFCFGFPLSGFLNNLKYSIGRNARMIACQPMDRICHEERVMKPSLFWRALVQVQFERLFGFNCEFSVGRLCSKATSFSDYFVKVERSVKKNLELDEKKMNELLIETQQQEHYERMLKFYCFRLALAPVVETIIILDKLLYLHEQGIENVYISKVFDGVKSPRCYAIIAMKMQGSISCLNI